MPRRRRAHLTSLALALTLALVACGNDDPEATGPGTTSSSPTASDETSTETATETPTETPTETEPAGTRIEIQRQGDSVTPNGERVEAAVGEPITLVITSDAPGELHVHSTPEQEVSYEAGTSEHVVTIDRPGVVEVESHEPALVILQLEVR